MRKNCVKKFGGGFVTPDHMDTKEIPLRRQYDIEEVNDWYYNEYSPEFIFTNENEHSEGRSFYTWIDFLKVAALGMGCVLVIQQC